VQQACPDYNLDEYRHIQLYRVGLQRLVSSYTELVFSGLFAEDDSDDGAEDWDASDYVWVEVNIDGGGYQKILAFENDGSTYNTVPQQDTDFDGNGDGAALTDTFAEFTANLSGTGATMDLRITTHLDSGDEDVAFDLLKIVEPPETPETELTITKVDLADPVVISTTLTYTVTVTNDSLVDAEGVSITDTLPAGVVFISATPDQGTCVEAALVVSCDLQIITAGNSVEVVISVDAPASTDILTNNAEVVTTTPESNVNNNAASEDTIITASLDYVTIYEIQYTDDVSGDSPWKDVKDVTTEGIVSGAFYNGYFLQDPAGGAWNGLWVYDVDNKPLRGDRVRIVGTVTEYYNNTEIENVTAFTVESSGNPVPGPEVLSTSDANLEQWEGVLVQVQDVVVTGSYDYGEWSMDDGSGDLRADDKGNYDYDPSVGDELIAVTGLLDYSFGLAKLQPRDNADIIETVLRINEINADPDIELGDANGDGVAHPVQDEFVEIVNISTEPYDISGWTLSDSHELRHTFPEGTIIPALCSIVVFGGGTPTGDFGNAVVQVASEGVLGLTNKGDTIIISDGTYTQAVVTYGSEGGNNQSLTRDPDVTGDFVLHSTATGSGGALFSPGTKIDGSRHLGCNTGEFGMCGDSATFIHDVQGDGLISPIVGMPSVVVEAVVVGDFQGTDELHGFYLQEEDSDVDANMATSEGVFVYEYTATLDVNIGDVVRLQGTVDEYYEVTQIKNLTSITVCTGILDPVASAAVLDIPVVDYEDFESYEGMKTSIPETLWVSQNYFQGRYGQVTLSSDGRLYQPTQIYSPDSAEMWDLVDENQRRMIVLDDGTTSQNPYPIPYIGADNTLRAGDTTDNLIGVMDYGPITNDTSVRHYRIQPLGEVSFIRVNDRVPEPVKENEVLRVASFNVLNLFNGDGLGGGFPTSRGADTLEEYDRQLAKIVDAMYKIDAEIFGLMEIENDPTPNSAIEDLVTALNVVSTGTYDFIDTGVIGTDEIKVALIYKTETVTQMGAFAILDSSEDPTFLDTKNRPVLAQTFMDNSSGQTFTVAVNHLKSKGSPCDDVGDPNLYDGQGNCNLTRTSAAIAEANWLETNPTGYGDGDYLIIGDLNAYAEEDPVTSLVDLGYTNLQDAYIGPYAYSYIFDGGSGTLDHALATTTMSQQVLDVSTWHINTDEPSVIDYNVEYKSEDLYSPDPFRSSDHDPVLIDLSLEGELYWLYLPLIFAEPIVP